ncbi:MAG: FkbM family methyltransferase [Candidatus Micrarchaeota archaeon]|nr:FkbM family methyltransferase [Candidatus Micrarchaeota archaeon]
MGLNEILSVTLQKLVPSYKRNLGKAVALHGIVIEQRFAWLLKGSKKNTIAIDIGAYIGDTAIYFASFGNVKRVYAYEPYRSLYEHAAKNIKISKLSHKIRLFNMGVGDVNSTYNIRDNGDIGSEFKDLGVGTAVKSISLNAVLKDKKNVIIKSNSEGSEHRIFTESSNLNNVYRIHIAYHYGMQKLPEILRSKGFKVRVWEEGNDAAKGKVGTIYARR